MRALLRQVPVMDTGARGATNTFAQRGIEGDVLLAWENEVLLVKKEFGSGNFDIVYPSLSILAEPPVAIVDSVVDKQGTPAVAQAYLEFLYTQDGQQIIARNYYRPRDPAVAAQYAERYPKLAMTSIQDFDGRDTAQTKYFGDGDLFDRVFSPGK